MMDKVRKLANMLDFDGCVEALKKIDNMDMVAIILDRMEELDEKRFIEFCEEY